MSSVTEDDFNDWVHTASVAAMESPEGVKAIAAVDDGDALQMASVETNDGTAALTAALDQLLATPRGFAVMATKVAWSPTVDGESSEAWSMVAVTADLPAWFGVRRLVEDDQWWRLEIEHVPWFMLSTASALRRALETGEPLTVKEMKGEAEILRTPTEVPRPPLDEKGRL